MLNDIELADCISGPRVRRGVKVSIRRLQPTLFISSLVIFYFGIGLLPTQGQSLGSSALSVRAQQFYHDGLALVHQNRLDEGIATLKRALEYDAHNLLILDAVGATYSLQGNLRDAEGYFVKALTIDPSFNPARKNLAITYFTAAQYERASAEFERLKSGPGDSRTIACFFLGILAEKKHEYSRSVLLLRQSGPLLRRYPESLIALAKSLYELHQAQAAKDALLQLDNIAGGTPAEYLEAGNLYSQLGDDQRALSAFDRAEKSGTPLEGVKYKRAEALARLGRSQEALGILADIAASKPNPDDLNRLAHVAEDNHQYDLAIQSLRLAAKLDPKKEDNYLQFSTICSDAGKYTEALQAADLGLQYIPNSYRLSVQKAAVLDNVGRRVEAEHILQKAVGLSKDNSEALLSLAIVQTNSKELDAAANTLRSSINKFPSNFYMRYWLGYVLVQIEDSGVASPNINAEAEHAFRAAIRLRPTFVDSYYQLSRLYMHKDEKLAEQSLTACLRVDPNYGPAQYVLAQLYLKTGRRAEGYKLYAQFKKQQEAARPNGPDTENN
ncbi:MAG TPA: tetratricopeptide repeat protein [Verrucomicrobiae bacterium]|nr:tetratricopeptide repeat protein [Verrucomicrobiae bacterium]